MYRLKPLTGLEQYTLCYCFYAISGKSIETKIHILTNSSPIFYILSWALYKGNSVNPEYFYKNNEMRNFSIRPISLCILDI